MFDDKTINEHVLKQFAAKFINLKELKINFSMDVDKNVLLFWQIITTNNNNCINLELTIDDLTNDTIHSLINTIGKEKLKIKKLTIEHIDINDDGIDDIDNTLKFIQQADNICGLNHLVVANRILCGQKLSNQVPFKFIKVFQLYNTIRKYGHKLRYNLNDVNNFLGFGAIIEKQLFVIVNVINVRLSYCHDDSLLSVFKKLCQNVNKLFVQQVAIDVKISFKRIKKQRARRLKSYLSIYSSYFQSKEFFENYDKPKCKSHLCLPRDSPYTYFYCGEKKDHIMFSATNVYY